jgi:hypothetical protein
MPLAAPPPPPSPSVDAPPPSGPPADVLDLVPPPPPVLPAAAGRPAPSNLSARIGLVLSAVLALAGIVSAAVKAGDGDGAKRTTTAAEATHDPATTPTATASGDDPLGASTPAEVPPGFEVRHGDGLSLAVPADWRSLDADDLHRIVSGENLSAAFPDIDDSMVDAADRAVDGGALFMAMDTTGPDRGRSINAIKVRGEAPLGILEDSLGDQLAESGLPAKVVDTERRDTPLGRALRVQLRETVAGQDLEIVQYYVPFDGSTYIVTGTAADDIVDQAVQTLRVGDTV